MATSNDEVAKVRLLVETCKNDKGELCWYQITSMDEYGVVCRKKGAKRDDTLERCKKDTEDILGGACDYTITEMD